MNSEISDAFPLRLGSSQVEQVGKILEMFEFIKKASWSSSALHNSRDTIYRIKWTVQHRGLNFMVDVGFYKQLEQWKREEKGERERDYLRFSCGNNSQLNEGRLSTGKRIPSSQLTLVRTFPKFQAQISC